MTTSIGWLEQNRVEWKGKYNCYMNYIWKREDCFVGGPLNDICTLVVTCDRYSDIWPAFFGFFDKNWSDCPYPVFLGSNFKSYVHPKVRNLLIGTDISWSESLKRYLEKVQTEYVLTIQEDFLIKEKVDSAAVIKCFEKIRELNGASLQLVPHAYPTKEVEGCPFLREIPRGVPFRCSNQARIWKKDVLKNLLVTGETAWQMEINGSERSNYIEGNFYATRKKVLSYSGTGAIKQGAWVRYWAKKCLKEGFTVDVTARHVMTMRESFLLNVKNSAFFMLNLLPLHLRKWMLEVLVYNRYL